MSQEWIRDWQPAQDLRWHVPASAAATTAIPSTMHTTASNYFDVIGQRYRFQTEEEARHANARHHHEWPPPACSSMGMINYWPHEGNAVQSFANVSALQYPERGSAAANGGHELLQQVSAAAGGGMQLLNAANTSDRSTIQFLAPAQATRQVLYINSSTPAMQADARSSYRDHSIVEIAGLGNTPIMQKQENMIIGTRPRGAAGHEPQIIRRSAGARGGKDRHSKVKTAKGLRDRRVRLSVSTAVQFYDIQDRLGFPQPSQVFEWLMAKAKPAMDQLPPATHHHDINDLSLPVVSAAPTTSTDNNIARQDHTPPSPDPAPCVCIRKNISLRSTKVHSCNASEFTPQRCWSFN